MNKNDLVRHVADTIGYHTDAKLVVDRLLEFIKLSLLSGDKVIISGVGTLYTRLRKSHIRHDPNTMKKVQVPVKRVLCFTPSQTFEQGLNKK